MELRRSALVGHSVASTFELIEAAEHYPEFLPWCTGAVILARDEGVVMARIAIDYHGFHFELTTRNPKRPPHWMAIHAVDLEGGPLRRFEGEWQLVEVTTETCKIEFMLDYEFDNPLLGGLASIVSPGIASTIIDAFARRAEQTSER